MGIFDKIKKTGKSAFTEAIKLNKQIITGDIDNAKKVTQNIYEVPQTIARISTKAEEDVSRAVKSLNPLTEAEQKMSALETSSKKAIIVVAIIAGVVYFAMR